MRCCHNGVQRFNRRCIVLISPGYLLAIAHSTPAMSSASESFPPPAPIPPAASKSPPAGADGGSSVSTSPTALSTSTQTAGAKRPAPANRSNRKDGEQLSEKKLRRLEKNRLSARECRRRKREATENMERQINLLNAENLRLRLQLQVSRLLA